MTGDFQQCGKCDLQRLRSACPYAQSDQSLCKLLEYSMTVKLKTEHLLELLSLREAAQALLSLHLSKCHIVGIWKSLVAAHMFMNELTNCLTINHFGTLSCWSPRPVTKKASVTFLPSAWCCIFDKDTLS